MDVVNPVPSLIYTRQFVQNGGGAITFTAAGANVLQISVPVRNNQAGFVQAHMNAGGLKGAIAGDVTWGIQKDATGVSYSNYAAGPNTPFRRFINVPALGTYDDVIGFLFVTNAAGNFVVNVRGVSVGSDYVQSADGLFLAVYLFN